MEGSKVEIKGEEEKEEAAGGGEVEVVADVRAEAVTS